MIELVVLSDTAGWHDISVTMPRQIYEHQLVMEVITHNAKCLVAVRGIRITEGACTSTTLPNTHQKQAEVEPTQPGVSVFSRHDSNKPNTEPDSIITTPWTVGIPEHVTNDSDVTNNNASRGSTQAARTVRRRKRSKGGATDIGNTFAMKWSTCMLFFVLHRCDSCIINSDTQNIYICIL